jgi:hypothetical protein
MSHYRINRGGCSCIIAPCFIAIMIFAISCTFTTTTIKNPEFKIDLKSVITNLVPLVDFKNLNLNGREKKSGKLVNAELEIDVINAVNIPSDETKLQTLGKAVASQIRQELVNPEEYNTYKVLFVTQKTEGGRTKGSYRGSIFQAKDL